MKSLADEPHHDGSELYVGPGKRALGATVRVRIRIPAAAGTTRMRLRSTPDGEPSIVEATVEQTDATTTWWAADLLLHNPTTTYRFLLDGGPLGRCWLNGAGVFRRDVTDDDDFRISTAAPAPLWLADTVGYQVFIDRFANSGRPRPTPEWAIVETWDAPVDPTSPRRGRQWFGGDLIGVEEHLEHLAALGVNLIYLTPFFPARSMHRYDASTFDHVDPALGGDEALATLTAAAHARGIRVIGDITLNHTGAHHDWFEAAQSDLDAAERGFYYFDDAERYGYVAWHGVPSLPKIDHASVELQRRLYDGYASVIGRFLAEPFDLDGWRVDCANTTGRFAGADHTHRVAHTTRTTMNTAHDDDRWLVAEHCYDAAADLDGTGWHGVMAYQWLTRPLWAWLKDPGPRAVMSALELIDLDGVGFVDSVRHLSANVSWDARNASMTMLDSHDTARFRSVVGGDAVRHLVGLAALCTMPGVPTLFAGSEVGVEGDSTDSARVPFPWSALDPNDAFLAAVRSLVALRRTHHALQRGGVRWIDATADTVTYVRETLDEVILVDLVRTSGATRTIAIEMLDAIGEPTTRFGSDVSVADGRLTLPAAAGATIVSFLRR